MGADIYYDGLMYNAAFKGEYDHDSLVALNESENYFRDSYNNTSVFWQMDLSWWADVGKVLDKEGRLPIPEAMKLRKRIEKHPIVRESIKFQVFGHEEPQELTESERDEWFEYFTEKRQTFLNMLDRSIEYNSPLICSV